MKVLFISSGNTVIGISPIIKNQMDSLQNAGCMVEYFPIKGKGIIGYLKAILPLRKHLKSKKYDIIHAHYSLSAYVATLAGAKPLVVSLMGSDVNAKSRYRVLIKLIARFFWRATIVKSHDMKARLGYASALIIPNGVNFRTFMPLDKKICQMKLGWDSSKRNILFAASPSRPEKNFELAKAAFDLMSRQDYEIYVLDSVPNEQMPIYHNAADVVLLTSKWEGSPNVIKEAMACGRPIVSTDVGDVKAVVSSTPGCFITSFNKEDVATKLAMAIGFGKITNGRNKINYLNSEIIARKIISIYKKLLVAK